MNEFESRLDVPVGDEFDGFAVFVVGGAVRDAARGVDPEDFDLMAVPRPGEVENPVEVLSDRMTMIDPESTIPVFDDSHGREVALPRTEENSGVGHKGFNMSVVPAGTPVNEAVRVDLERRDLRVNALAFNARTGDLFDPHNGLEDLENGVVRHVSEAFREDPLRVVRLARFAPRLHADVAPETEDLARDVAENGQLAHLPVERVTKEFRKVVHQADNPGRFFQVLDSVNALEDTFPVVAGHSVDAVAQAVTDARNNAPAERRLDAVLAVLGAVLGDDARAFADQQDVQNQERATLLAAREGVSNMAVFHRLDSLEAVSVFDHLGGERGADVEAFVDAAESLHADVNRGAVDSRLADAREAFEFVDGAMVMDAEGVQPGVDVSGEEFGEMMDSHRARLM